MTTLWVVLCCYVGLMALVWLGGVLKRTWNQWYLVRTTTALREMSPSDPAHCKPAGAPKQWVWYVYREPPDGETLEYCGMCSNHDGARGLRTYLQRLHEPGSYHAVLRDTRFNMIWVTHHENDPEPEALSP